MNFANSFMHAIPQQASLMQGYGNTSALPSMSWPVNNGAQSGQYVDTLGGPVFTQPKTTSAGDGSQMSK